MSTRNGIEHSILRDHPEAASVVFIEPEHRPGYVAIIPIAAQYQGALRYDDIRDLVRRDRPAGVEVQVIAAEDIEGAVQVWCAGAARAAKLAEVGRQAHQYEAMPRWVRWVVGYFGGDNGALK